MMNKAKLNLLNEKTKEALKLLQDIEAPNKSELELIEDFEKLFSKIGREDLFKDIVLSVDLNNEPLNVVLSKLHSAFIIAYIEQENK